MAKGHYSNMVSQMCCRCHARPRRETHTYCTECVREYNREWARKHRGCKPRPVKPVVPPGMKFCTKCERTLPVARFSRSKSKSDGLMSHCKDCDYFKQLTYKEKNKARVKAKSREFSRRYRAAHPGYNARACMKAKRKRVAKKIQQATEGVQP